MRTPGPDGPPAPVEYPVTLYLDDEEHVTVQATPLDLEDFAIGYLYAEGLIAGPEDIRRLAADPERGLIWVDLRHPVAGATGPGGPRPVQGAERGVLPGGLDALRPVPEGVRVARRDLVEWLKVMGRSTPLYRRSGGVHAAMLVHVPSGEHVIREDIGRHNAVDKVIGAALRRGWTGPEAVLLTSGRISFEMCARLVRFGAGLAASRTTATDMAVELAGRMGVDLIGYLRGERDLALFTSGRRLLDP
ncbi:formate dehydrogenase accessory sulfurtransferase FdhD [Caldinitratiruptor microaerophilus]|uniref:FdhD protein n=1 Tax=Caldinitratiruptor microaerophilus TaxID=671077 RepID=A0AA35CJR5_9FIRM|nr:formate dehydrogenase accessory sulfurtransferase FdhD [Caldinitratiruptor microaerophilus]BDG60482.1 hypothetical protein caldi_15720 [Caldinitratiruptor microaerophilus]